METITKKLKTDEALIRTLVKNGYEKGLSFKRQLIYVSCRASIY
jgi:hypothetical protein